jgi:RNA polymerase sigma-70 factor (ECF subfamily)
MDDAELAQSAAGGDRHAYATLVDRHLSSVYSVVRRIVFNSADAEDLTQDTFVRALTRLDQYGRDYPFRNWLLKIATNLAINQVRSRQRERARFPRLIDQQQQRQETGPDVPTTEEWQRWLARLDSHQRTALVLFHFQEMSYAEIARVMEVPVNTVRTYLHRGRNRLKELISAKTLPGAAKRPGDSSPDGASRSATGPEKGSWTVAM